MDGNLLKYMAFIRTVEYGSFTKAAKMLNYSQSGISILPHLILKRIPYDIVAKELSVPACRNIGLAMKDKKTASLAVKRFLSYLDYRHPATDTMLQ